MVQQSGVKYLNHSTEMLLRKIAKEHIFPTWSVYSATLAVSVAQWEHVHSPPDMLTIQNSVCDTSSCTQIDSESISDYFLPVIRVNLTELILHAFYKAARRLLELPVS